MIDLKPCPFCGHKKSRLISKTELRMSNSGLVAYEYIPDVGFGGGYEVEIPMLDFRHAFYCRCNKCGARSKTVRTEWHIRTDEEAEEWSRSDKYWGFDQNSEWALLARVQAVKEWNTRDAMEGDAA